MARKVVPSQGSASFPWPGLDPDLSPSAEDALATLADRFTRVREYLATIDEADFDEPIEILENGPNSRRWCADAVFEETFWHNRYARRDLATLATGGRPMPDA